MLQQETEAEVASSSAEGETSSGADSLASKTFDQYLACQEKAVNLIWLLNMILLSLNRMHGMVQLVCKRPIFIRECKPNRGLMPKTVIYFRRSQTLMSNLIARRKL